MAYFFTLIPANANAKNLSKNKNINPKFNLNVQHPAAEGNCAMMRGLSLNNAAIYNTRLRHCRRTAQSRRLIPIHRPTASSQSLNYLPRVAVQHANYKPRVTNSRKGACPRPATLAAQTQQNKTDKRHISCRVWPMRLCIWHRSRVSIGSCIPWVSSCIGAAPMHQPADDLQLMRPRG